MHPLNFYFFITRIKPCLPQVLCVNYCSRVTGSSLKILLQRCRNLKCLMLQQTSLQNEHVMAAEWEKADNLQELGVIHQIFSPISYSESTNFLKNIHCDFFFNWQTEKKTCFEPIGSLFSFSTTESEKKFVKQIGEKI